jgi:hypothetical protein
MHDIEFTDRQLQETFNLINIEQDTASTTYKEQNALTLHFACNNIDTLHNIARKYLKSFNRHSIPGSFIFCCLQEIF